MDTSTKCADSMFCHNSEGLQDAIFCFNTKGKRHAIGNAEFLVDAYKKVKDALIEQMASELIKNKGLKYDIFNISCK
jgi:hypothetical protein